MYKVRGYRYNDSTMLRSFFTLIRYCRNYFALHHRARAVPLTLVYKKIMEIERLYFLATYSLN